MAKKVTVTVSNGTPKLVDCESTIGKLREEMKLDGYEAAINGDPANDDDELFDYANVQFSVKTKGGVK